MPFRGFTFAVILAAGLPALAPAAGKDVLAKLPAEAGLAFVIEQPRGFVEAVRNLEAYESYQSLPAVRQFLESTAARRFFQIVNHFETELKTKWPELLDKLAGNGIGVAGTLGMDNGPTLLVLNGSDETTSEKFFHAVLDLLEQEALRGGAEDPNADKLVRGKTEGFETATLGKGFHAARDKSTIYIANQAVALKSGLELAAKKKGKKSLAERPTPKAARELLGGEPLGWLWLDFAAIKENPGSKDFFEATRKDLLQTLVVGSTIDALRRSDFVAGGVYRTADGFKAVLRVPAKRDGLPAEFAVHAPPAGEPGSLPFLEPKGVLYSQSFYYDFGKLWSERAKLINDQQLKDFEKAERDISRVIPGPGLGKILEMSGPHHRLVAAQRSEKPYKSVSPEQPYPALALVTSMRDPQFGKSAAAGIRAGAFFATFQYGLKIKEETVEGIPIVSYRFPEDKVLPEDPGNVRFNFVPSFAIVDKYFVFAGSPELIADLIPELRKPLDSTKSSPALWRAKVFGAGAAEYLKAYPDAIITNAILTEALGLDEAKKQVAEYARWISKLGTATAEVDHKARFAQVEFTWNLAK